MIHAHSEEMHFKQILTLIRRRWIFMFCIVALAAALGVAAVILHVPKYTAKSQLLYEMQMREGVEVVDDAAIDTLVERLVSPDHIRRLAESLAVDPPALSPNESEDPAAGSNHAKEIPPVDEKALVEGLNAYKQRQSSLIAVTYTATRPDISAAVANRAVSIYLDRETNYRRNRQADAAAHLEQQIPRARADLERAEAELRTHRISYGFGEGSGPIPLDGQLGELTRQFMIASTDLEAKQEELKRLGSDTDALAEPPRDLTNLPGAPEIPIRASDAVASDHAGDKERISVVLRERDAILARKQAIEARLDSLRAASTGATRSWTRLRELEREASAAGQAYETLLKEHSALLLERGASLPVRWLTTAAIPEKPSTPNPVLFLAPALIAAFIISGLIAVLLERLDQRLRSEHDIETTLGVPCIGLVPILRRPDVAKLRDQLCNEPFSLYTEAIRSVFVAATRRRDRVLLVSSDGRSTGTAHLALSLGLYGARLGQRVLLVDFDLRQYQLSAALDAGAGPRIPRPLGEYSILSDERLNLDHLKVTEADGVDPLATVSDGRFEAFLREAARSYDCIVIYGAPPTEATETRLLATLADHVLLNVRWGVTEAPAARAAVQALDAELEGRTAPLSVIITGVRMRTHRRMGYGWPAMPMAPPGPSNMTRSAAGPDAEALAY